MSTERYSAQQCTRIMKESKPARKMVLLGKTGDGKSSSGNTILSRNTIPSERIFTIESSPESLTAECKSGVAMVDGRTVTVIDTPGIFDTCHDEEDVKSEIFRSIIECAPAVDALVIVLKVQRYTGQEIQILDKIVEYCGEATFKHGVVLFTHGEDLEDQTIKEFVKKSLKLQELVDKCGGRCHVIDNKHWNDCQLGYRNNRVHVKNMLETIDKMVKENGCYTNELLSSVEEDIQDEMNGMDTILLTPEEKREAAKKKVHNKYLSRFAGVATGTLVGAFMGLFVAVGSVVALLKAAKFTEVFKAIATTVTTASTLADKAAVAAVAAAGAGTAAGGTAAVAGVAGVVEAGIAAGTAGAVAVEAGIVTGAATGAVAVEAGVAAGAGIGAAAGTGIAAGVILGTAALAGAIGGGITGYKAAEEADSVRDAIKMAAKATYENAKEVVRKAEQLPSNVYKKLQ
ncbi:unnamed protein product [Leuciscus chuanchicus]